MFDLGDTVPLTVKITDASGAPTNAGSVTLTITLPDNTTVTPTTIGGGTGVYQCDYVPSQIGRHILRWVSTAPNTAYTDVFDVRPAALPSIISVAEVKQFMRMDPALTTNDELLRVFIEGATKAVEDHLDQTVARRTVTENRELWWTDQFTLNKVPAISLTSIRMIRQPLTQWDMSLWHLSPINGVVTRKQGPFMWGYLEIVYEAGYQVVPANISLATKIIVQHLWEVERGTQGPVHFGGGVVRDHEAYRVRAQTVAIPPRAQELLGDRVPLVGWGL